jgi:DNA polymerase-3 subunit alpha
MFGVYKFFNACKAAEVKPLIGCEFYVVDDVKQRYIDTAGTIRRFEYHQTVLAMNPQGWENLCKLGSMACKHQYYYVPRIDRSQLLLHNDGLIVLSGCFKGTVAWHLMQHDPEVTRLQPWCCRSPERSRKIMQEYHAVYGDRYFIECQHIDGFDQYNAIMPELIGMARDEGVKCVVTNDCHYEREEDAVLQALMSRISKDGVGDGVGGKFAQKGSLFIKRRAEIVNPNFTPDMFDTTVEIMERCDVDLSFKGYMFPAFPIEADIDYPAFLAGGKGTNE